MADIQNITAEVIAASADVVLVVGPPRRWKNPRLTRELHVSSAALIAASDVYATLLKREPGHDIAAVPREIHLPEDRAESMSLMCRLLQGKYIHELVSKSKPSTIGLLAFAVQKYACAEALRMQTAAILLSYMDRTKVQHDASGDSSCVVAAYLFDDARAFHILTGRLLKGMHIATDEYLYEEPMPEHIIREINERRTAAQHKVEFGLMCLGEDAAVVEEYDEVYVRHLMQGFGIPFWPPDLTSVASSFCLADCVQTTSKLSTIDSPKHGRVKDGDFKQSAEEVEDMCQGLCLKCVKEDNYLDIKEKYCAYEGRKNWLRQ
ncbi:uncharacterized protein LTR77_005493 [Saxophila tyrrhenica]|uniref:Uncharacterized protein n=1 Tax=Saxophila tyrrhenica TaxID=1690608 RepID=A0AAV9PCP1_9PEZI|nr:hypothetical protein LTR77_005493 [Saxophila tyrrhenica]